MSPVSRARKRKPGKGKRNAGARGDRGALSLPGFGPELGEPDVDPAAYLGDLPSAATPAEAKRILDRRMFAVPQHNVTINAEDYFRLDPGDPDEHGQLIESEHPEYHRMLVDPAWDGEIDGVNPRLHLALHEVIANQLWADDPPEAWQAARRLRDSGMERHDVLHELLSVLVEHMYPVLAGREPFDTDAYRQALGRVGHEDATGGGHPAE